MGSLDGKVAIVTGAARGIGREIALSLGRRGAAVTLVARSTNEQPNKFLPGTLENTAEKVAIGGARSLVVRADVSNQDDVDRVVAATREAFGEVDILVNNAAAGVPGAFLDVAPKRWASAIGVNIMGPVMLSHAVLPGMVERGYGRIVNISSGAAAIEHNGEDYPQLTYGSTKAALERMSVGLGRQFTGTGVSVNVLRPGTVFTEALMLNVPHLENAPGVRKPDALGEGVAWLVEQPADFTARLLEPEDLVALGGMAS